MMIESFRHKGLQRFFEADEAARLPPDQLHKIGIILSVLDVASVIDDMNQPYFRLHALKGELKGYWAVTVRANWRIVFRFEDGNAFDVDFLDYH